MRQALAFRLLPILLWFGLFSPSAHAQSPAEQQAFLEAERYYNAGIAQTDQYEKARYLNYGVGLYQRYLDTFPNSPNAAAARFRLGHSHQSVGRIADAQSSFRELIRIHKRGPWVGSAARQLGYLHYVQEEWEKAAQYFGIAAEHLNQDTLRYNALTKQVQALLKLNRPAEITAVLQKIVRSPNHPYLEWAQFMLGYQYFEEDRFELAIETLKPLLDNAIAAEYRSQAYFYTGLAAAELGQDDLAETHLRSILAMTEAHPSLTEEQRKHLSTNKAKAQTALMGLHSKKKNWSEVIALYEMGNFEASGRTEIRRHSRAGQAYFTLKNYRQARTSFRRVDRATSPDSSTAFTASFYCLLCDYHLAEPGLAERVDVFFELYQKKFSSRQEIETAKFIKAETLLANKTVDAAARTFQSIDENRLHPSFLPELLFKRGWCLSESGQFDGALRDFGLFLARFPDDPRTAEALNKRAEASFSLGDFASALRDFEAALKLDSSPSQTAFALQGSARVLRQEKNYQPMIARYRQLLADFPNLPRDTIANANYWIGWGFFKLEEFPDVPPYLRKARDLVPEFYNQPVGDLLILTAFNQRDKEALHQVLQEIYATAPAKPVPPQMLSWLGVQLFHDGLFQFAADYLERSTNPDQPQRTENAIWRILAKAQNRSQAHSRAEQTALYLLSVETDPRWKADTQLELAEAQIGLKKYPEAIESAQKGLAIDAQGPHLAGLHLIIGEAQLALGEPSAALVEFERTIAMIPDDPLLLPRALHGGAEAAEKLNQMDKADQLRSTLNSQFPNWKPASQ